MKSLGMTSHYATPRPVNVIQDPLDFRVVLLGSLGFTTDYIASDTGLTKSQVTYRLGKGEIKRADYRRGESAIARSLVKQFAGGDSFAAHELRRELENKFPEYSEVEFKPNDPKTLRASHTERHITPRIKVYSKPTKRQKRRMRRA